MSIDLRVAPERPLSLYIKFMKPPLKESYFPFPGENGIPEVPLWYFTDDVCKWRSWKMWWSFHTGYALLGFALVKLVAWIKAGMSGLSAYFVVDRLNEFLKLPKMEPPMLFVLRLRLDYGLKYWFLSPNISIGGKKSFSFILGSFSLIFFVGLIDELGEEIPMLPKSSFKLDNCKLTLRLFWIIFLLFIYDVPTIVGPYVIAVVLDGRLYW